MDSDMPDEASLKVMTAELLHEKVSRSDHLPDLQHLILRCVTYAARPLRLLELADLVEQTHNPSSQELGTIKALVRSACVSPLQIMPDETVQVVHHSSTEPPEGQTHNDMALLCISYLEARLDIVQLDHHQLTHISKTSPSPPFLQYAALNWHAHARNAMLAGHDQIEVNARILTLLKRKDNIVRIALLGGIRHTKDLTPIILATVLKLTSLAREILEQARAKNTQISLELPFRIAARIHNDADIINLLLQHGVDPAASSRHGETPLNHAIRRNCHDIARALLDAGLEPFEDPKSRPTTAGSNNTIFRNGDPDMIDLFLSYVKTAESAQVALNMAVTAQKHNVIKRLLQHPAINVNAKTSCTTPLYKACTLRDARSIRHLLNAGADPNKIHKRGGYRKGDKRKGWNVLYALAGARSYSPSDIPPDKVNRDSENTRLCFRLVLDAGADVHLLDWENRNALHHATDVAAVECLLEAGVDANAVNLSGETLLNTIMDVDIIQALATRVDVNAKSQVMPHCGQSPLLVALKDPYSNNFKIAKACCLLDLGADATAVDDHGSGTLHYAVSPIRVLKETGASLLRRLIAQGADVNLQNDRGQTPLHCCLPGDASRWATKDSTLFLELLINAGADLEVKDNQGRTPLSQIMSSNGVYDSGDKIKTANIMVAAGARMDTLDGEGRNLLHGAMSAPWTDIELVRFLISHGIGTDDRGNTIWHMCAPALARAIPKPWYISGLVALGVNREEANEDGIAPIHIVVKYHPCPFTPCDPTHSDGRRINEDEGSFFDHFIHKDGGGSIDVDRPDRNGVTPLHIAATFSEYLTRRLLEEGADPTRQTAEGLTVLHLAARSWQTNTTGLLLASLRTKEVLESIIDLRDRLGRSALWYACASGRPEVAQMLLKAGASIHADSYIESLWAGCVALQDELMQAEWLPSTPDRRNSNAEPDAGGVLISDTLRGRLDQTQQSRFPIVEERLDEIVGLLVFHGCGSRYLDEAIASAVAKGFDHATECLLRARESLDFEKPYELDRETSGRLIARGQRSPGTPQIRTLMSDRRYALVTEAILDGSASDVTLEQLVKDGFSKMVGDILSHRPSKAKGNDQQPNLLLLMACRQPQWNMDVVRLLAEAFPDSLNVGIMSEMTVDSGLRHMPKGSKALHVLVRGGRWWQVEEALPYLLGLGADTKAKDKRGLTPLAVALQSINGAHFSLRAVEALLQAGADPNAVDRQGRSCLSMAEDNDGVYRLLTRHMRTVTPPAMTEMIKRRDVALLAEVLANGADANGRVLPDERDVEMPDRWAPYSFYPLEVVFMEAIGDGDVTESEKMVKVLLNHGADPSARYAKTTIMHQLVDRYRWPGAVLEGRGRLLKMMLQSPKFNLEHVDDRGMTVLHVAAARRGTDSEDDGGSLVQVLIDAGANVLARDKTGMTVLHHLMASESRRGRGTSWSRVGDIRRIVTAAPGLVSAVDDRGETPLHRALGEGGNLENAHALINAGADVKMLVGTTGDGLLHLLFRQLWVVGPEGDVHIRAKPGGRSGRTSGGNEPVEGADMLRWLLELGLDVNSRNKEGKTPIFGLFEEAEVCTRDADGGDSSRGKADARATESEEAIWRLLEAQDVDWKAVSSSGETLLHVVARSDMKSGGHDGDMRRRRFRFLLSRGVDVASEDEQHRTPLDIAAVNGRKELLKLVR